jgi:acyl-CoA reductase-like NAD-dependent aldehyde dehydrogenase
MNWEMILGSAFGCSGQRCMASTLLLIPAAR